MEGLGDGHSGAEMTGGGGSGGRGSGGGGGSAGDGNPGGYDPDEARRHVEKKLRPNNRLIGERFGRNKNIRKLSSEDYDPEEFFDEIAKYGTPVEKSGPVTLMDMPGVGTLAYRTRSKSGHLTIDVKIPGIGIKEIKFV